MNKKKNEQLKKLEKLDKELDNTINKIGTPEVKPWNGNTFANNF